MTYIDFVSEEGIPKQEYIARINNGILDAGLSGEYFVHFIRPYISCHLIAEKNWNICSN